MADARDELRTALVDWLESEREVMLGEMRRLGVPDEVRMWVQVVTKMTETETSLGSELRGVNPLTLDSVSSQIDWPNVPKHKGPADQIHAVFGRQSLYWQVVLTPSFEADPVAWIQARLLEPASRKFLHSLTTLSAPARAQAGDAADELLKFIESNEIALRVRLPLGGLHFDERLSAGPVLLRPLEPDEVARVHQLLMDSLEDFAIQFHLPGGMHQSMFEVTELRSKSAPRAPVELAPRIILALQLLGFNPWGPGHFTGKELPYGMGTSFSSVHIAESGTTSNITQSDLERAVRLAVEIPKDFASSQKRENIALSRFGQGCADKFAADALIDLVIALEAVLLPREFQGELSFRFALNGAHAIGASGLERKTLYKEFADVYNMRSDVVHGKHVELADLQKSVDVARRLSAAVLLRGLESGWRTQEQFRDAALS